MNFRPFLWLIVLVISAFGLFATAAAWLLWSTPRPSNIQSCFTTEMYKVHLCPDQPGYARSSEISTYVKLAVVASEDTTFYTHNGIDLFEVRESFAKNWATGQLARGGSTITQQLAKNLYLNKEKSFLRKLRELMITLQIEKVLNKDQILEKYLNVVEFGPEVFGVTHAAQYYFRKTPADLDLAEGIWLAFVLPSPKKYSASFQKKQLTAFARSQMLEILGRMKGFKQISEEESQLASLRIAHFFGSEAPSTEGDPRIAQSPDAAAENPAVQEPKTEDISDLPTLDEEEN